MILIDSNIPMYLIGRDHPHKVDVHRLLETLVVEKRRLVTDTEVFQEILHRYVAINRRDAIQPAFDVLQKLVDEIIPVEFSDIERAKMIVLGHQRLSARDAVHLAVMERQGISDVATFDRGFDGYPGIRRLS
ncbi:MAG: VapC toxin family PIN domain ribonuclease [Acidobacteria bacterium]|nr:MAG: VapC toxin family PIN domain ribonuclease [Acidobacteriota bacterium]